MRVMTGECRRLMIFAPPRHGKSQIVSRKFPAYYLGNFPNRQVIIASHNAGLAKGFSRNCRDILQRFGPETFGYGVRPDKAAEDDWGIVDTKGRTMLGGMRSFGVGGGMLGEGAHLLLVDDPITGDDSLSPTMRQAVWDWWKGTAMDRLNPGGKSAIIMMMQRLNSNDLAGRLLEEEGDDWEVLTLRAEAEEDDVLGRRPGEWLWPWGFSVAEYERNRRGNPYWWSSKYQQRPVPRGGGMFQTAWIDDNAVWYRPETDTPRIRFWDLAGTQDGGDYTVGALLSRKGDNVYIEDIVRGQWASGPRDAIIRETCEKDNRRFPNAVVTWLENEPASSGKIMGELLLKKLSPYAAHAERSSGQKHVRADGLASAFARGEVHVCKGHEDNKKADKKFPWYDAFVAEFSVFGPNTSGHDDQVDACSGAFNKLSLGDGDRESATCTDADDVAEHEEYAYSDVGGAYG